ncbi:MAG: glycosyl hydrolase family 18 protein [Firmicutes bacterium]|nr:glycosyl hydrolase family 18 protein [Bacillota bacterium]
MRHTPLYPGSTRSASAHKSPTANRRAPHRRYGPTLKTTAATMMAIGSLLPTSLSISLSPADAATVPPAAVALYKLGLSVKAVDPSLALKDFTQASVLAPNWEPPVYEEGALLAVANFPKSIPVLMDAARINPEDDTVWNILGWGYYQAHLYGKAEIAFRRQLHIAPGSGPGLWGLANCYANSTVRQFAQARVELSALAKQSLYRPEAERLLSNLPPNAVDPTQSPTLAVTTEDAIAMLLSWRNDTLHYPATPVRAGNGLPASADVAQYVAFAAAHSLLTGIDIPSFQAPATRLTLALLLANFYGINPFDYVRPFALFDVATVPIDEQMTINSVLANRLLTPLGAGQFGPNATMTRSAFAGVVAHANTVMAKPPTAAQLLTPPAPVTTVPPVLYFFTTSQPDASIQDTDLAAHSHVITAIGLTDYPFVQDFPAGSARTREKIDQTQFLLTAMSAGPAVTTELSDIKAAGIGAFMVLSNYNNITHKADPGVVQQMLSSASTQQALVQEIVRIVQSEQLAGVTVDLEDLYPDERVPLLSFVQRLHTALSGIGRKTMVCLPERDQSSGGTSPYDYAGLGAAADYVMLITYDEHVPGGPAGDISTLSNTQRVVQFAVQQIPADKILVGAADYGYDWVGTSATEVSMAQAEALAQQYGATISIDPASETPTFHYTANGQTHVVWFENEASIADIEALVHTYGLLGLSVWHLGSEDAAFWQAITG